MQEPLLCQLTRVVGVRCVVKKPPVDKAQAV
jgi:hypothetical protein